MRRALVLSMIFFMFISSFVFIALKSNSETLPETDDDAPRQFFIEGNDELRMMAEEEGWNGTGNHGDPFIIEGYTLGTDDVNFSLVLSLVSDHVIFRDCRFLDDLQAEFSVIGANVQLELCSNVTFEECSFLSMGYDCLFVLFSDNISVKSCTFQGGGERGSLVIAESADLEIIANNFLGPEPSYLIFHNCRRVHFKDNIMQGPDSFCDFSMVRDSVLSNNTVTDSEGLCWLLVHCQYIDLVQNRFTGYGSMEHFLVLDQAYDIRIKGNTIEGSWLGIYFNNCFRGKIFDNLIDCNHISIAMSYCDGFSLQRNQMTGGGLFFLGDLEYYLGHEISDNNTVNGKPVLFLKNADLDGKTIGGGAGQIFLVNISDCAVEGARIEDTLSPINLVGCRDVAVRFSILAGNSRGIRCVLSEELDLSGNKITNCEDGIEIEASRKVTISENQINVLMKGVDLGGSYDCIVKENNISGSIRDVVVLLSERSRIEGNTLNGPNGLRIVDSVDTVITNNIVNNGIISIPESVLLSGEQPEPAGNIVDGKEWVYLLNRRGFEVDLPEDIGYLGIFNSSGGIIRGIEMSRCSGIDMVRTKDILIEDVRMERMENGLRISESTDIVVNECSFADEWWTLEDGSIVSSFIPSIRAIRSGNCFLTNSTFDHPFTALSLDGCSRWTVENNRINGSLDKSISVFNRSRSNLFKDNVIEGSRTTGIAFDFSLENIVMKNRIENCTRWGVSCSVGAYENLIYLNIFKSNNGAGERFQDENKQVHDSDGVNYWCFDGPQGEYGNFWSDLRGPDEDEDLVADDPYPIWGQGKVADRYPMMEEEYRNVDPRDDQTDDEFDLVLSIILLAVMLGMVLLLTGWMLFRRN
ncbi:MAG: NosD domain-containing protein [Thermoplasmatota archaeon]